MRSYDQYCGLALALDVVGDRWTLLIVRELLASGACRYTDLQYGLPGIATNLLADRLRHLEDNGVIVREAAPPPIATTLFRLTPRGEELRPALEALGKWGRPLMVDASTDSEFRSHWLVLPLGILLADQSPDEPPVTIEVRTGDEPVVVEAGGGKVHVHRGPAVGADATVTGSPRLVLGFLSGQLDLKTATAEGLEIVGDKRAIRRVRPGPGV